MRIALERKEAFKVLEEINTEGHRPLRTITADFDVYIVKSGKGDYPPLALMNEVFCSFFLQFWNIPTPEIALVKIDPEDIDFKLSPDNKSHHFRRICFGSKYLPNSLDASRLFDLKTRSDYARILNPADLLWIALFDIWIGNEDRTPNNLNMLLAEDPESGKLMIHAIDHAQAFHFIKYKDLDPDWHGDILPVGNSILDCDLGISVRKRFGKEEQGKMLAHFEAKVAECKRNFFNIADVIRTELGMEACMAINLSCFLFSKGRNKRVFQEFITKLI